MSMHVEAIAEIASRVAREWGENYNFTTITPGPIWGSAIGEVYASDGSRFYVGALRYGQAWAYGENRQLVSDELRAKRRDL